MVERAEIEAKVREIEAAVDQTRQSIKNRAVLIAVGVLVVIGVAYILGRRRGRPGGAVVEVYEL